MTGNTVNSGYGVRVIQTELLWLENWAGEHQYSEKYFLNPIGAGGPTTVVFNSKW